MIEEQTNQQREAPGGVGEGQFDAELDRGVIEAERLLAAGQLQAAFATIKAVIGQKPHHAPGLRILGKVFAASGHVEESDSAFRASLELDPTVAATWMGLGLLCRDQRRTGEARHCFEQAVLLRPNDPFLLSNLAVVLGDSGQIAESIRHFEAALRVHPEAMTAHSNLLLTLHYDPAGTPSRAAACR